MNENKTKGLWINETNPVTGENSLQEHKPKVVMTFCKQEDHYFEPKSPSSRELKCNKCGMESYYILGYQKLIDGKVINQS